MHIRNVVVISAFAIVLPLASVAAQNTGSEPAKWSASVGVDPTILDLRQHHGLKARMVANLTRSWQSANSPLERHLSLIVGGDAPVTGPANQICVGCWERVAKTYAGLTAATSLELFRESRFSPYARTGLGVYYTKLGAGRPRGAEYVRDPDYFRSGFSLGVNGGLGLKARLWSREFLSSKQLTRSIFAGSTRTYSLSVLACAFSGPHAPKQESPAHLPGSFVLESTQTVINVPEYGSRSRYVRRTSP